MKLGIGHIKSAQISPISDRRECSVLPMWANYSQFNTEGRTKGI